MRYYAALLAVLIAGPAAKAQWAQIGWERVAGGLKQPVLVTGARDGSGRLFVVELEGKVRILKDGSLLEKPFLDLSERVGYDKEHGLLSIAFPPGFASNKHFYADFIDDDGAVVIARYRLSDDPNVADVKSEEVLLRIEQPYGQHNGGMMAFSPVDGRLYVSTGDGGIRVDGGGKYTNDPLESGQDPESLLGKILRIDTEAGRGAEIWSLGWRNPWRFSFDRKTGDFFGGDVGADGYEEINYEPAGVKGRNYGWSVKEGSRCVPWKVCAERGDLTDPVVEYAHSSGCSVTGGYVYRGKQFPELDGTYFYGDFCRGTVWAMKRLAGRWESVSMGPSGTLAVSFGEDDAGELYLVDYRGVLYRMRQLPPGLTVTQVGNGASGEAGMVPGSLASANLAAGVPGVREAMGAEVWPLPLELGGVSVWVNGVRAGLTGVTPEGRVEFQVPWVLPGETAAVQVRAGVATSNVFRTDVKAVQPGLLSGDGRMALVVNEAGEKGTGGARGAAVALYGTGFGPVTNGPPYGYPAVDEAPLRGEVRAMIGGKAAVVEFCALAPGFAGIYSIVVRIAADAEAGDTEVWVSVDGVRSPALRMTVN